MVTGITGSGEEEQLLIFDENGGGGGDCRWETGWAAHRTDRASTEGNRERASRFGVPASASPVWALLPGGNLKHLHISCCSCNLGPTP